MNNFIYLIIGVCAWLIMTGVNVIIISYNRDDTPIWETIVISLFFTPVLALLIEMLKPYNTKKFK